jgi:isopentenyl diphosphate isomerase/L-lactate dehydrogenase-like FMN-dependent dehydrogenase
MRKQKSTKKQESSSQSKKPLSNLRKIQKQMDSNVGNNISGKSSTGIVSFPSSQINMDDLITVEEYHQAARRRLPKMYYDYYRSGADAMLTLDWNQSEFQKLRLRPRMLIDVSNVNTKVTVMEHAGDKYKHTIDFPVMIAPTAMHRLAHPEGEKATARAAARMHTIYTLSSLATTSAKHVAEEVPPTDEYAAVKWFQLYILKDRNFTRNLIIRVEQLGYKALVVTADAPKLGNRIADHHNKFHLPEGMALENLLDALKEVKDQDKISSLNHYFQTQIDASLSWKDIEWLRTITKLPILVKGILTSEDTELAVKYNVDGIVVSNHGARQVDTTIATIEALPEVVDTVRRMGAQDRVEIFLDGGIQKGTDVLKAIALGAKAVFIGRTALWGLSVGGEQGVVNVLSILKRELILAMQLCGCPDLKSITPALIKNPPSLSYPLQSKL